MLQRCKALFEQVCVIRKHLIGPLGSILLSLALATPGSALDLGRRALLGITASPLPTGADSIGPGVLAERVLQRCYDAFSTLEHDPLHTAVRGMKLALP
jgi:hypothetical protein